MKKQNPFRYLCVLLTVFMMISSISLCPVSAKSYQYDTTDTAIEAPSGYEVKTTIRSSDFGKNAWTLTDIYIDKDGTVYLLEQQSGTILIFDAALNYQRTIHFYENGAEAILMNLNGFCVRTKDGETTFYVADTDNKRIFLADQDGNIFREITKPDSAVFDGMSSFSPMKVGVDSNGNLYVLVSGMYQGLCVFSAKDDYAFMNFLAGNQVESTASIIADYFWKQILTKSQVAGMKRYIPVSPANFTIDARDNIFTVTNKSSKGTNFENEVKKFNANSVSILPENDWGDVELDLDNNYLPIDTSYVDLSVNDQNLIAALDGNLCRVAVFNSVGDRLITFGERNHVQGAFDTPAAIEMYGNDIYVADSYFQSLTVFTPNEYGKKVLQAAMLNEEGRYEEAFPIWQEISKQNGGFSLAFTGMGKQYLSEGKYKEAMDCFKIGDDRKGYSEAFSFYRNQMLQKVFPLIAILLLAGFVGLLVLDFRLKNKRRAQVNPAEKNTVGKIIYTLFHPCEGGMELARKTEVKKTAVASIVIVSIWFIVSVIRWCFSGFIFNENKLVDFNVWTQLGATFGLYLLWIGSGWLVSNLMDSSARFSDMIVVTATALIPYIIGQIIATVLSNVLSLEEGSYINVIVIVCLLWSIAVLWGGMREIHEMNFRNALLCMIFTLFGMALVVFLMILLWSLCQQVIDFATQIIVELRKMLG
ncbi:MAG: YIP1 family protein, partial [Clostridia bacterium]|nr:YIP1 family protein [Clostridia bacterium]